MGSCIRGERCSSPLRRFQSSSPLHYVRYSSPTISPVVLSQTRLCSSADVVDLFFLVTGFPTPLSRTRNSQNLPLFSRRTRKLMAQANRVTSQQFFSSPASSSSAGAPSSTGPYARSDRASRRPSRLRKSTSPIDSSTRRRSWRMGPSSFSTRSP